MKRITIFLVLLLAMLAGCKKETIVSNEFTYSHKFVERDFLPIVQGELNGRKTYFLLDTGASVSILDLKESAKYNVKQDGTSDVSIGGYGGVTSNITNLKNVKVTLGVEELKKEFTGKDIGYIIKGVSSNTGLPIVGIIGNNNISSSEFILDFENNLLLKRK